MTTVRDGALEVLRQLGGTTLFANPGSTEISLLTDLDEDFTFILALHEGSVVGLATGYAIASDRPAVVILHTTAGLGNAVGALATARENRAPLVVIVGQQDRRHLAANPFLSGHRLDDLAGDYPVWIGQPARSQDVPGTIARAWQQATHQRGPALVIVPMDDWEADFAEPGGVPTTASVVTADAVDPAAVAALAKMLDEAKAPVIVAGAGNDDRWGWESLRLLAEKLQCPVWQEPLGARAGFPQDHPLFAGHLPAGRSGLRAALLGHDVVLSVGAPVFRQYPYEPGALLNAGVRAAVVTQDLAEATITPVELAIVAQPARVCSAVLDQLSRRSTLQHPEFTPVREGGSASSSPSGAAEPASRADTSNVEGPLEPAQVFSALASRLPAESVVVEESPSSRAQLQDLLPARRPLGFLSAAMGGLGFGLPAAVGVRMARPDRPVVAVLGDGSSLYAIQALWSAAHYGVGVLVIVLANGRYAIMDRLAQAYGDATGQPGASPWPAFAQIDLAQIAAGFGCPSRTVTTAAELDDILGEVVPTLGQRSEPLLLNVVVT